MRGKQRAKLSATIAALLLVTILYPFLLYTDNLFVTKWRTIYIETAMSTMTHQWLATAIIPSSIIEDVMQERTNVVDKQKDIESSWFGKKMETVLEKVEKVDSDEEKFFTLFSEIDRDSFASFAERNPNAVAEGYTKLKIDWCDKDKATSIRTTAGDAVRAVDAEKGILIIEVTHDNYNGRLAIIKDASTVRLGTCKNLFSMGQQICDIADRYDATVAMNASGFIDPEGHGNGGTPYGYLKVDGEKLQDAYGGEYKIIGFDNEDRMQIGSTSITKNLRDAVEFGPALIVDGEQLVKSSAGWGLQPRSAIGQTDDKTVLMLVVDGRQPGHSLGCTVLDSTEIMLRYGATQAINLDGGSSSIMYYNGREITSPTNASGNPSGRYLPCAFLAE